MICLIAERYGGQSSFADFKRERERERETNQNKQEDEIHNNRINQPTDQLTVRPQSQHPTLPPPPPPSNHLSLRACLTDYLPRLLSRDFFARQNGSFPVAT